MENFLADLTNNEPPRKKWYQSFFGYLMTTNVVNPHIFILTGPHAETIILIAILFLKDRFCWESKKSKKEFLARLPLGAEKPNLLESSIKRTPATCLTIAMNVKSILNYKGMEMKYLLIPDPSFSLDFMDREVDIIKTTTNGTYPVGKAFPESDHENFYRWVLEGAQLFISMQKTLIPFPSDGIRTTYQESAMQNAMMHEPHTYEFIHHFIPILIGIRPNYFRELAKRSPEKYVIVQFTTDKEQGDVMRYLFKKVEQNKPPSDQDLDLLKCRPVPVPFLKKLSTDLPQWGHIPKAVERFRNCDIIVLSYSASIENPRDIMNIIVYPFMPAVSYPIDKRMDITGEKAAEMLTKIRAGRCMGCKKTQEETKFKMCGKCRFVPYCSPECQRANWPEHKRLCGGLGSAKFDLELIKKGESSSL